MDSTFTWWSLLGTGAYRMILVLCDPMLCPIYLFVRVFQLPGPVLCVRTGVVPDARRHGAVPAALVDQPALHQRVLPGLVPLHLCGNFGIVLDHWEVCGVVGGGVGVMGGVGVVLGGAGRVLGWCLFLLFFSSSDFGNVFKRYVAPPRAPCDGPYLAPMR